MFEKVSWSLKYDSIFFVHQTYLHVYVYMDSNTDLYPDLAARAG